ncbi:MAG: hypothetical protein AAF318_09565 [Pseudomonadota bacterium]
MSVTPPSPVSPDDRAAEHERLRRRKLRSLAIAAILGAMVVLFYLITMIRLSS